MIVSLKRWRPLNWSKLALGGTEAKEQPRKERKPKMGYFESFEKMAESYADTIIRAATK